MITSWLNLDFSSFFPNRGISSTVRRCICKETGREFAAKIIDLGAESGDVSPSQMNEATRQEIAILRQVMGHPYISKCAAKRANFYRSAKFVFLCFFFQLNCKMYLNQMPSFSLCLNCAGMVNCSIIWRQLLHFQKRKLDILWGKRFNSFVWIRFWAY